MASEVFGLVPWFFSAHSTRPTDSESEMENPGEAFNIREISEAASPSSTEHGANSNELRTS